jgi:hypothetical protein
MPLAIQDAHAKRGEYMTRLLASVVFLMMTRFARVGALMN